MAPLIFPINDWDGNGSTDDLYDIMVEMKVRDSLKKEEKSFLDKLFQEIPLAITTDVYSDDDFEMEQSENGEEIVIKAADIYKLIWIAARSIFKEYLGIEFDEEPDLKTVEESLNYYKGGWREKCESGSEYYVSPYKYKTEAEYVAVLEYAKRIKERYEAKIDRLTKNCYIDEKCEENKAYTYCGVVFEDNTMVFYYITDDESIKPGDVITVPVGTDNDKKDATVVSIGKYLSNAVPYPVEKTKNIKIERKLKEDATHYKPEVYQAMEEAKDMGKNSEVKTYNNFSELMEEVDKNL